MPAVSDKLADLHMTLPATFDLAIFRALLLWVYIFAFFFVFTVTCVKVCTFYLLFKIFV